MLSQDKHYYNKNKSIIMGFDHKAGKWCYLTPDINFIEEGQAILLYHMLCKPCLFFECIEYGFDSMTCERCHMMRKETSIYRGKKY